MKKSRQYYVQGRKLPSGAGIDGALFSARQCADCSGVRRKVDSMSHKKNKDQTHDHSTQPTSGGTESCCDKKDDGPSAQ